MAPAAFHKLQWFLFRDRNEVAFFGLSSKEDPLLVTELIVPEQEVEVASCDPDGGNLADVENAMADAGYDPVDWNRIWIHTHPNMSANPSSTDLETFKTVFGQCQWAVMAIVSRTGDYTARLQMNVGPGGCIKLNFGPETIDWSVLDGKVDTAAWEEEYARCIKVAPKPAYLNTLPAHYQKGWDHWSDKPCVADSRAPANATPCYTDGTKYVSARDMADDHEEVSAWALAGGWIDSVDEAPGTFTEEYHDLWKEWRYDQDLTERWAEYAE